MTFDPMETPGGVRILSVEELVAAKEESPHGEQFNATVSALPSSDTQALLARLKTTEDALLIWAIHLVLDRRDVPPCLRHVPGVQTRQVQFITWLADLLWFTRRHRKHSPAYKTWAGLFKCEPASVRWHRAAIWIHGRSGRHDAHYFSKALGLDDAQRQPLMTMPTHKMVGDRGLLLDRWMYEHKIETHAIDHRDRSGTVTPTAVAKRRMEILRVFLLSGRSPTLASRYLELSTGRKMSRQAITGQVEMIEIATGLRLLK